MNQMEMKRKALKYLRMLYATVERTRKMWEADYTSDNARSLYYEMLSSYLGAKDMAFFLGLFTVDECSLPEPHFLEWLDSPRQL